MVLYKKAVGRQEVDYRQAGERVRREKYIHFYLFNGPMNISKRNCCRRSFSGWRKKANIFLWKKLMLRIWKGGFRVYCRITADDIQTSLLSEGEFFGFIIPPFFLPKKDKSAKRQTCGRGKGSCCVAGAGPF